MAVHLLLGRAESEMMAKMEDSLHANPDLNTLDFKSIFYEIYHVRHECASDGPREDFIRRCLECDATKRMTVTEALAHPYINEPASVRHLFELREKQTTENWTGRPVHTDLIQSLPDVLTPTSVSIKDKREKTKLKHLIVGKPGTWKNENETAKSPYFGKVTKQVETKRARSDESTEESRTKRRKEEICLE